ncbi:hypothetical protein BDV29DRAFT_171618 [Aspergillus leporis]|uniref:Uncharacterized protein n=1 Tax=Aspergillus leporis TaxID=41062 RepID=A0A5N5X4U3_9EURO|nr:hypothetical protein BDV29DRAFT_171618 [Aspergillus leporis]
MVLKRPCVPRPMEQASSLHQYPNFVPLCAVRQSGCHFRYKRFCRLLGQAIFSSDFLSPRLTARNPQGNEVTTYCTAVLVWLESMQAMNSVRINDQW